MITQITKTIFTGAYQDVSECYVYGLALCHVADVRHIVDKAGNNVTYIIDSVKLARKIYDDYGKVIITCDMGVSRSRVVAIGLLAEITKDIDKSISTVLVSAKNPEINPDLLLLLRRYYLSQEALENQHHSVANKGKIVLGSKGFVGSNLIKIFQKKQTPFIGLCRSEIDIKKESIRLLMQFDKCDHSTVIYCAHPSSHHSASAMADSLLMLKNTLEACRLTEKRLIFISDMSIYLGNAHGTSSYVFSASENEPAIPYGCYSETKYLCESLINLYRSTHGLDVTVLRSCGLYGLFMKPQSLIPKLIYKALANEEIVTHKYINGPPILDLLHVDDFCNALCLIVDDKLAPSFINIGGNESINTYDLASKIVQLAQSSSSIQTLDIHASTHAIVAQPGYLDRCEWQPSFKLDSFINNFISNHYASI